MRVLVHLGRRFFGSLSRRPLAPSDEEWVHCLLNPDELSLWEQMPLVDQKHAAQVARRVQVALAGEATDDVFVAALLHDVGKVGSRLGVIARVMATVLSLIIGRKFLIRGGGRVARYLRHDSIGSELLGRAGSAPLVVAWAREHHLPAARWSIEPRVAASLKAADDD